MTDHTPTTEEVRDEWAYGNQEVDHDGNPVITLDEAFAQFDRWLAAHDRKVAERAWDAAVRSMRYEDGTPVELVSVVNPYRADRIEQGGQS